MYLGQDGALVLFDSRPLVGAAGAQVLDDLESRLYVFCDSARTLAGATRAFPEVPPEKIAHLLDEFCDRTLMWTDGERYLSLALSFTDFLAARESVTLKRPRGEMLGQALGHAAAAG